MTTEVKAADAFTREELEAIVARFQNEASRCHTRENTQYASDRAYWQGWREASDAAWLAVQQLLDDHRPEGTLDEMPF